MTPEELATFNDMILKVNRLYSAYFKNDFPDSHVFEQKLVSRDIFIAEKNGIKITSKNNPRGCYILTGNSINDTQIKAEYGTGIPNGSLYLSSSVTQPFFVNYNGTWILVNLP